jgi:outer membrane lipopolysaccharide assembly protein LptE/RlpB
MRRALAATTWIAVAALSGGCGYSTRSLLPEGVRTLAVDVFGNETFYREIEFQLTRELTRQVNVRTHYRLARRESADAILTGRILSVSRPTLVENRQDLVSEQAVIVTAEVTLTDRHGRVIDHLAATSNRAEFIVERGETLETAFDEALADLAEQIINRLQDQSFLREMGFRPDRPRAVEPAAASRPVERISEGVSMDSRPAAPKS